MIEQRPHVSLYDADRINPYGRELAAVLGSVSRLRYWGPRTVSWVPDNIHASLTLGASKQEDGLARHIWLRLWAPFRVLLSVIVRREILVVAWPRGAFDAWLFAVAAPLIRSLVVVNHNPSSVRSAGHNRDRYEGLMKRRSTLTVVHSEALIEAARRESERVRVARLPTFHLWAAHFVPPSKHKADPPTVLFLGATRPDKGVADFVDVVELMRTSIGCVIFAGRGTLDADLERRLTATGVKLIRPSTDFLSDAQLGALLSEADLVIAPYRQVTQSGSAMLAVVCGLGVVAYADGGLADLVNPRGLVPTGDVARLASRADAYFEGPWPSAAEPTDSVSARCMTEWSEVIEEAAHG